MWVHYYYYYGRYYYGRRKGPPADYSRGKYGQWDTPLCTVPNGRRGTVHGRLRAVRSDES
jgi:hypothetical protein